MLVVITVRAEPAGAATRPEVMRAAAAYAASKGYHVGIAVIDTETGATYGSGDYRGIFASESVVKAFIATRLLARGEMTGATEDMATRMIRRSDDAAASALYGRVGGDRLMGWMKERFNLPGLGYRPSRPGWWGNTHITPLGVARFYAKIRHHPTIGPWLMHQMHRATRYGSDGTYQFFGLPSAASSFGVKQGWGNDDDGGRFADFNTTGFVNANRYAVAILARGPTYTYGSQIGSMLTRTAKLLLPGGRFPDAAPRVRNLSRASGSTSGGTQVTVRGTSFTQVTGAMFGAVRARDVAVLSATAVRLTAPTHQAGWVNVRILTSHGRSPIVTADRFEFVPRPKVSGLAPATGPPGGGTTVTISGTSFRAVTQVRFGAVAATSFKIISPTSIRAVAPPHKAGQVNVAVVSAYGQSSSGAASVFTYKQDEPGP